MEDTSNPAAQIQKLREIHISTERDHQLKKHIYRLFEVDSGGQQKAQPCRYTAGQETRGVILIEEPGGGKTTAVRTILQESQFLARIAVCGDITTFASWTQAHWVSVRQGRATAVATQRRY